MQKRILFFILASLLASTTQAQTCKNNIKATTPDSRFEILGNGSEVKDKQTGLIWQRCSIGQSWNGTTCTGEATSYTWQNALKQAKALGKGYRLPNIKELASIVELKCYDPAINLSIFPKTPSSWYWSSSPGAAYGNNGAWGILFSYGNGGYNDESADYHVRAVRSE